jgi:hypothetical protein
MTVTVQSALTAVATSVRRLREAADELVLFAEDEPSGCQVHLVTIVQDAALDLAAEAAQADAALTAGHVPGPDERPPAAATPQAVARCQAHLTSLGAVLVRKLAEPERLNDLAVLGREHGRDGAAWAKEIARCIAVCQQLIWTELQPAFLAYWEEIIDADRDAANAPSRRIARKDKRP